MMQHCRVMIVGLAFVGVISARAETWDSARAIQHALDNSPAMERARLRGEVRELEVKNARNAFLPKLDFQIVNGLDWRSESERDTPAEPDENYPRPEPTYPLTRNTIFGPGHGSGGGGGASGGGTNDGGSSGYPGAAFHDGSFANWFNLQLTENLYDNGISSTRLKIARLKQDATDMRATVTRNNVVLDIAHAYVDFSRQATFRDEHRKRFEAYNTEARRLGFDPDRSGPKKPEQLQLLRQLERARMDWLDAERNTDYARIFLRQLLDLKQDGSDQIDFSPDKPDMAIQTDALEFPMPDIRESIENKALGLDTQIADFRVIQEERANSVRIFLTAGANYLNTEYLSHREGSAGVYALVTLRYNLLDWGTRKNSIAIAVKEREMQSNLQHRDLIGRNAELSTVVRDLHRLKSIMKSTQRILKEEDIAFAKAGNAYKAGKMKANEYFGALEGAVAARIQFYRVYFEYSEQLKHYHYFDGSIYDRRTSGG